MIVVKIEIWPGGDPNLAYEHSRAEIANKIGTTMATGGELGDYEARFFQSHQFNPKKIWKRGSAKGIHRRNRGVWDILFACLANAGMLERNRDCLAKAAALCFRKINQGEGATRINPVEVAEALGAEIVKEKIRCE